DLAAEVVQLRPVHVADRGDVDLVDLRRMQRERPLDADAEGVLAHGERLTGAGTLALDHDPLEDLDPLAVALDDLEVNAHGVPRLESRHLTQLGALELLDDRAHRKTPRRASVMVPATDWIEIRGGGQYVATTLPIRFLRGTNPHFRESQEP